MPVVQEREMLKIDELDSREKVIRYYIELDSSYQNWGNKDVYELHYGYKDSPNQNHYQSLVRMNEVVAEKARVQKGDIVLDAGCGVGASVVFLAKCFAAQVYGISLCDYQVEKAKKLAHAQGVSRLTDFSTQDFTNTDFPDNFFDVVWGIESICYASPKTDFLREAYRVLKPGGHLVVADYFLVKEDFNDIESYSLRKWEEGWAMPSLPSQKQFQEDLILCEYNDVEIFDITDNIRESAQEIYERGKQGYPEDIFANAKNVMQMKHVEACIFQKVAMDLQLWKYQIFVATK